MNRSLAIVCNELHIVHLEDILYEVINGISVEQWVNMDNSEFTTQQSLLCANDKLKLKNLIDKFVNALPSNNNLAGGIHWKN